MKKLFMGIVWFFVIMIGISIIAGLSTGVGTYLTTREISDSTLQDEIADKVIPEEAEKQSLAIFFISLGASIFGTFFGILPGTKSEHKDRR